MKRPVLVIMAAGMGSRYGGLKQIDPIDEQGHIMMDYSLYDAYEAGFREAVFIIKEENRALFAEVIGDRIAKKMQVTYVFQDLRDIPEGFALPDGRVKPWGTGHAVRACRHVVSGAFAVINADDYYGPEAFRIVFEELSDGGDDEKYRYVMAGYELGKTLTENGAVARGICAVDGDGCLSDIVERTKIIRTKDGAAYTEDEGSTWIPVAADTPVSLNMWGFTHSMMRELDERFPAFLEKAIKEDPLKAEYFLPSVVDSLLKEGKASVKVRMTPDRWYGMTYPEDRAIVKEALSGMRERGLYRF